MHRKTRIEKKRENMNEIRKMLRDGPKRWQQLLEKLKISGATLSQCLSELMEKGEIRAYTDTEDRRLTWYEAVKEQVEPEIMKYTAIEFIESLEKPLWVLEKSKNGKSSVSVFITPVQEKHRHDFESAVRKFAESWLVFSDRAMRIPKEGYRMAVVLTKEK